MRFEKQELFELDHCYSVKQIEIDNSQYVVFATEGPGPACLVNVETMETSHIWEEPGGTMCMVPVPRENGSFLSVQKFYFGFNAAEASIAFSRRDGEGRWHTEKLFDMPYLHRFDILQRSGRLYFVGGVLCRSKKSKDDWSNPGYIVAGELNGDSLAEPVEMRVVQDGLTKNHGYGRIQHKGVEQGLFAAEEGVFIITPPANKGGEWSVEHIFDRPTSEARLFDIDGDGVEELVTIEPFHGPYFRVYHETLSGYQMVYECPSGMDFCHVIWVGKLRGVPCILGACRRGPMSLFMITYSDGDYRFTEIDSGVGPSNIDVIYGRECDMIASANREMGRAAFYRVYD